MIPQRAKILVLEEQDSFDAASKRLLGILEKESMGERDVPYLLRIEATLKHADLFTWLSQSRCEQKFYWSDRNRVSEWMGLGVAIQLNAASFSSELTSQMGRVFDAFGDSVQFYGASRFSTSESKDPSSLWDEFPNYCFVLPIFEVKVTEGKPTLALNVVTSNAGVESAIGILKQLRDALEEELEATLPVRINNESRALDLSEWKSIISSSEHLLSSGVVQKIVLANAHDFWLESEMDPVWLLQELNQRSSLTYRFLFQLSPGVAFVGASPEQLFGRNGQRIESEAQAGTRPRGRSEEEDAKLAQDLLSSKKEFVEHDVVVSDIEHALNGLCRDSGWIDQRKVIKLSHVQHLRSRFGGILREGVHDAQIVDALHPTTAVCGWPKEVARKRIAEFEKFDRGYYCGPIGMIGKNKTEFAVALRSALVIKNRVRVFAGAGIVEGSIAENEWNEIDSKMRLYYDILGKRN